MQVVSTTTQRPPSSKIPPFLRTRTWRRLFTNTSIPREISQATIYDMGLGKELPQDLKGKVDYDRGRYDRGGYGKVFKGMFNAGHGKKVMVAVKFLEMSFSGPDMDVKIVQYLHRETLVWRTLKHPNILSLLGICSGLDNPMSPVPALISPYCPHGTLREYLQKHPETSRMPIAYQLASAVHYIHARDIIHGDVKPDNVLVDEEGRPLLCDFGRSRIVGVDGFDTTLTSSQHYTAPELLNSEDEIVPLTKPSDIFSLSVTLLRVITDLGPFHPTKGPVIIRYFTEGRIPEPEPYVKCKDMSPGLWRIFDDGWAFDPFKRPTADVYMARLEALSCRRHNVSES